jgi:mannose-6-phosphate isomerase-like protein (cupin superfamily)
MEEFYFFLNGKANLTINNMEYFCNKGTFITIPKNTIHSLFAVTSVEFIYGGIAI